MYKLILISKGYPYKDIERYLRCVITFFGWRKEHMLSTCDTNNYNGDLNVFLETFDFRTSELVSTSDPSTINNKNLYIKSLKILYVKILKKKFIYIDFACPRKENLSSSEQDRQRIVNFITIKSWRLNRIFKF